MKALIFLLILLISTTTYAASFEESYKNAKTSIQKIRLLISELKLKNAEIASLKQQISVLKEQNSILQEQVNTRITTREQELLDKILILNASNEDKDKEIQRLGKIQSQVPESTRCTKDYWGID